MDTEDTCYVQLGNRRLRGTAGKAKGNALALCEMRRFSIDSFV